VVFTAEFGDAAAIGRLDTTAGTVTMWTVPASIGDATRLAVAPDGSLWFNDNLVPYSFGRFDPASGTFISWPLSSQPAFAIASDAAGDIFLQEQSSEFLGIARFASATGQLTEWASPGAFNDGMTIAGGRPFFGSITPTGLAALDPERRGTAAVLVASAPEIVAPAITTPAPSVQVLVAQQASGKVSRRLIHRRRAGAFALWAIPAQPSQMATGRGAVFFTEASGAAIGRLTDGPL